MRVKPFYSNRKNVKVYHNNSKCIKGNNIEHENREQGINGRKLCERCRTLNKDAKLIGDEFIEEIKEMKKEGKLSEFEYLLLCSMEELSVKLNREFTNINSHLEVIKRYS